MISSTEAALHLFFHPTCFVLLLFSLGNKWISNYMGRNKTSKKSTRENAFSWLVEVEASNHSKGAATSHSQDSQGRVWSLRALPQQTDLKIHKPAGPETSVFRIYLLLTNTSHFYIALGKLILCKSLVYAIMVFSVECHMCKGRCWR